MGVIWRRTPNSDYGFDGEIELVKNGLVTGHIIKVQVKAGSSYFCNRTAGSFEFSVSESDLKYWTDTNCPVILIVYDPEKDVGYWKAVGRYLAEVPDFYATRRMKFSLKSDKFVRETMLDVCQVAIPDEAECTEFLIDQIRETLHMNLLPVKAVPSLLYSCELSMRRLAENDDNVGTAPGFPGGKYCAFRDPRLPGTPARQFLDLSQLEAVGFPEYFLRSDTRNGAIARFNDALYQHAGRLGLLAKERGSFYFTPQADGSEQTIEWSRKRTAVRKVAYPYYGKKTGTVAFWVHHACRMAFCEVGGELFLRLIPGYAFSSNGQDLIGGREAGALTTSRKSKERNYQVLNHLFFWCWFLSQGQDSFRIPVDASEIVIEASFVSGTANFGVPADSKSLIEIIESEHDVDWAALEAEATASGEVEDL
jgi:hypothetical protein